MVGKNNYKTRAEKAANKKQRFSLKKLSVGVASVAVGSTLLLGNAETVSAQDGADQTEVTGTEDEEDGAEEVALQTAKEAAKAELQEAGATSPRLGQAIDDAGSVEEVEQLKNDFLDVRRQQVEQAQAAEDQTDETEAPDQGDQSQTPDDELEAAKESAIAELQGIKIENETLFDLIRHADSVDEVKRIKGDIIDVRQQQVSELPDQERTDEGEYDFVSPSIEGSTTVEGEYDFVSPSIEGATDVEDAYDFLPPELTWSDLEEAVAEEEAQEGVYTLYYYGQGTQNQNGATTVEASSPREALEYFQNFLSERGLDAGDFNWHYESDDQVFTASEKIEGETSVDSEYDFNAPEIDWSGLEDAVAEEEAQEEVYTLYYYGQRTQNQNGATTVKASSPREALEYFQNFLSERGLDAGDFNWHYESDDQVFTASEKIEGETSVDSEYDFVRPDFDWSGLEEAIQDEENQEAVYTFVYITQNTKGKNGATTVKASSPEEALEYFQNWAEENDLGELDWSYDEDTKTFTGREKLEDDSDDDSDEEVPGLPGQDDSDSDDSTEDETEEEGKEGSDGADDTTSDDSKDQQPGQDAPVKPGKGTEGQVATPVQDSKQATGQTGSQATDQEQAPAGQAQTSNQQAAEESGQTLPDTATSTWALGLLGLSSLAGGLFAGKNKED